MKLPAKHSPSISTSIALQKLLWIQEVLWLFLFHLLAWTLLCAKLTGAILLRKHSFSLQPTRKAAHCSFSVHLKFCKPCRVAHKHVPVHVNNAQSISPFPVFMNWLYYSSYFFNSLLNNLFGKFYISQRLWSLLHLFMHFFPILSPNTELWLDFSLMDEWIPCWWILYLHIKSQLQRVHALLEQTQKHTKQKWNNQI